MAQNNQCKHGHHLVISVRSKYNHAGEAFKEIDLNSCYFLSRIAIMYPIPTYLGRLKQLSIVGKFGLHIQSG